MDPYQFLLNRLVHEQENDPNERRAVMIKTLISKRFAGGQRLNTSGVKKLNLWQNSKNEATNTKSKVRDGFNVETDGHVRKKRIYNTLNL